MVLPIDGIASWMQSQQLHAQLRGPQREAEIVDRQRAADTARAKEQENSTVAATPAVNKVKPVEERDSDRTPRQPWRPRRGRRLPQLTGLEQHIDITV